MGRIAEQLAPDLFSMVRRNDPETSRQAAAMHPALRHQDRILALKAHADNPLGLTDFELAEITGRQQTSIGKRRGELRDHGLIEASAEHRGSPSGAKAIVWQITARGIIEYGRL